jgi:hypothetical protein
MTSNSDPTTMIPKKSSSINGEMLKKDSTGKHSVLVIEVASIDDHVKKLKKLAVK